MCAPAPARCAGPVLQLDDPPLVPELHHLLRAGRDHHTYEQGRIRSGRSCCNRPSLMFLVSRRRRTNVRNSDGRRQIPGQEPVFDPLHEFPLSMARLLVRTS